MKSAHLSVLVFTALSFGAGAQTQVPESFRGNWKAGWKQPGPDFVKQMEAKLALTDSGGTWSLIGYFPNSGHYPCDRLKTTVSVISASSDEVVLKVNASAAVNGCADSTLPLKRIGEKNIGGKLGDAELVFSKD